MIGASRMEAASMASPTPKRITVDEFLAGLASNSERLELIDGVVTVIVGGTAAAHLIAGNVFGNLFNRLRGGPCVPFGDGMLVMVDEHSAFVPDVAVVCAPVGAQEQYLTDPTVIVEVLSPSTESFDRGFKWLQYQTIPSLRHYLLVAQDRHLVEMFSRGRDDRWIYAAFRDDPTAEIRLDAVGVSLILAEVYEGVTIASADATP
jgi:Uma2 family endonuclease